MKSYYKFSILLTFLCGGSILLSAEQMDPKKIALTPKAKEQLAGKQIVYVEREQYAPDHHNTATMFQKGEINEDSFCPGGALRIFDVNTAEITTLIELKDGLVRDPELSFDGKKIIFSMRKNKDDFYHIYEINTDGSELKQLTFAEGVSDIDPLYLPDGGIVFSSTRQPKYCMCNRHIMCNLYRMEADGANITQIGVSTLFEGHSSLLNDGRILYDRWEYVDRNFGDAQGLWTVNPDGTKHSIYYGNNTQSPGGVIDARQIPGTDQVICIFGSCHDRPWGALAIIDRKKGVDGVEPVVQIWPEDSRKLVDNGDLDSFKWIEYFFEDPYPLNENFFLASRTIWAKPGGWMHLDSKSGIYLIGRDGTQELIIEGNRSLFDPMIIESRPKPHAIPSNRNYTDKKGSFYVQNVYHGTHMKGVEPGTAKYLRVIESPEKRTWTKNGWGGQGEQAPAVNWHSFENKRILGEVPVEEDGSANFEVPSGTFVYFQLLDKDKKMIQSMRSGTMVMSGEVNGCIGCHEDRLSVPSAMGPKPLALKKAPIKMNGWMGKAPRNFSFMEQVQPILDKSCVRCHDFDQKNRDKLVLAKDKNPFFNAAYVNLYVKKEITLIGGGPAQIQEPYSWGSHASKLTKVIEGNHHDVKLSPKDKEILYTWMDLNGVYYPVYESAFDSTLAGRSPLYNYEIQELIKLTEVNIWDLNHHGRKLTAQISFDRPEVSPCLDKIRNDKQKYARAVEIIRTGQKRLKATPRGDIEKDLVPCERHKAQLRKYAERLKVEQQNCSVIGQGDKIYDK
ncbi:hypothetical protein AALM74_14455 [Parabacteroides segnis]|uniref:HzsA-related protein n=1 Tax=Parabacteroides segnis TaxID=2763058 RepID=UPI003515DFDE